jgi:hypothetical protein
VGRIVEVRVESVRPDSGGPGIVAAVASIKPVAGSDTMAIFASILRAIGTTGQVSKALGGQAYRVDIPHGQVVLTPLVVNPVLVVVVATGPEAAPIDAFVRAVLRS